MIKRVLMTCVFVTPALTIGGAAQATDGPAFNIYFYSDAAHTQRAGFARAACTPDPVAIMQWGSATNYREEVIIGECVDGVLNYYYDR